MTEPIKMIEIFSGIGAQAKALNQLPIPHEITATLDVDKDAILSYASMRYDLEKEIETYDFPSKEQMISELQAKNVGFDFQKDKHTITTKTNIDKVKQYYIADKLSKNLGDVSKVQSLPYVDIIVHSSPCQSFSQAGKGEGGDEGSGTTSSLMWESLRLIETSKPKYVLWENVAAILSGKHRHNFIKYLERMSELGYENAFDLLNGKTFGVPQNRLRIFCVSRKVESDDNKIRNVDDMPKSSNKQVESTMKEIKDNTNIRMWTDYKFPETIPLTTRLKDVLEKNVDEKYYLPDDRIEKIINSTFMQEKKRIQMTDVCDTLLARDWKDPKCVPIEEPEVHQIMNIMPTKTRDNPNQGRVYDVNGIAPTLTKMDGGNREPMVIDEIKVVGNYMPSNHDASRVVDINGIAPTVKENHGTVTAIAEPQVVKVGQVSSDGSQAGMVYAPEGIAPTLCVGCHGYAMGNILEEQEPFIVASRGRNPENPSDRTTGAPTEQRLEPNFSGCTNTLTSVRKDNYVCEPQVLRAERTEYGKAIRKQYEAGEIDEKIGNMRELKPRTDGVSNTITTLLKDNYVAEPIIYDDYNSRISSDQGAINTLTCNCGASAERNGVKIIEPIVCEERKDEGIRLFKDDCVGTLRTIDACGDKRVIEPELEFVGGLGDKDWAKDGKQLSRNYPQGSRVYSSDGIASALTAQGVGGLGGFSGLYAVDEKIKWRIRKLMPIECWKLMGFSSEDHNRAAKYVSNSALYKQAGNSIIVDVLVALMSSLFIEDGHKADVWTKYTLN